MDKGQDDSVYQEFLSGPVQRYTGMVEFSKQVQQPDREQYCSRRSERTCHPELVSGSTSRLQTKSCTLSLVPSVLLCLLFAVSSFAEDYFKKANELYDRGNFREAVAFYRAAIREEQYEPFAWFNLGNTLVHLGRNEVALTAYKRAAELMPDLTKAWQLMGDIYYLGGNLGEAMVAYHRALELGEDSDHLHFALAECYLKGRDFTLAQKHFERAVYLNPDRMDAWYGLAEVYEKLGYYEYALKTLKNALQLTVSAGADVYFTISHYYTKMDSTRKALNAMEDGLLIQPENADARRYLAQMYLRAESPWMAIFVLEEGLNYKKNVRELEVDLGLIYFEQKRYDEAFEYFLSAYRKGSAEGRLGAENVGNIWYNAGDLERAERVYQRIREKK
ncbi:MAG: tetratricopeptide repeat protein [Fibrobacter sp.]|nr:tetratricopeptide repeat protein [Fibrobacter sp.]